MPSLICTCNVGGVRLVVFVSIGTLFGGEKRSMCVFCWCQVFWLIPPTEENLSLYMSWTLSSRQNDIFFGDVVKSCYRITLEAGWTFFIPTGISYINILSTRSNLIT